MAVVFWLKCPCVIIDRFLSLLFVSKGCLGNYLAIGMLTNKLKLLATILRQQDEVLGQSFSSFPTAFDPVCDTKWAGPRTTN